MKTISILGLGLMGGSLGLALRQAGKNVRVQAFARREETRQEALERGMADAVFADPAVAVQGADLVVACVPVCRIPEVLEAALPGLADGVLVTDVGSSKAWLTQACRTVLADSGAVFVGSHPMCGSERTGLEAADAELYRGSICVVCSDEHNRGEVWKVTRFWAGLGARVVEMPDVDHDAQVARTSHVPHVAASALVRALDASPEAVRPLIGPGFRDTTRVAAGCAGLWRDILKSNTVAVREGVQALVRELQRLDGLLAEQDFDGVEAFLAEAAERREALVTEPSAGLTAEHKVVAIDGPSASGKSTVARQLAARLDALYVDSGAMYRGMTWKVLREQVDPQNEDAVRKVMQEASWDFPVREGAVRFTIDGEDPGEEIRGEAVRETVSYVARIPEVRQFIVESIRGMQALGPLVVEGRDIGSVIFPDTRWKFYLDADPVERARRRNEELRATEDGTSVEAVQESLRRRDHLDSTRKTAPLQVADGAEVVDTTHLTLEDVVLVILERVTAPAGG